MLMAADQHETCLGLPLPPERAGVRLLRGYIYAQVRFGTDGWRAVIAEDFSFANVARVAQATADHWSATRPGTQRKVIIGHDAGFSPTALRRPRRKSSPATIFRSCFTPGTDADARRFICGEGPGRGGRSDDHREP